MAIPPAISPFASVLTSATLPPGVRTALSAACLFPLPLAHQVRQLHVGRVTHGRLTLCFQLGLGAREVHDIGHFVEGAEAESPVEGHRVSRR